MGVKHQKMGVDGLSRYLTNHHNMFDSYPNQVLLEATLEKISLLLFGYLISSLKKVLSV